jgi:hypothetical protein
MNLTTSCRIRRASSSGRAKRSKPLRKANTTHWSSPCSIDHQDPTADFLAGGLSSNLRNFSRPLFSQPRLSRIAAETPMTTSPSIWKLAGSVAESTEPVNPPTTMNFEFSPGRRKSLRFELRPPDTGHPRTTARGRVPTESGQTNPPKQAQPEGELRTDEQVSAVVLNRKRQVAGCVAWAKTTGVEGHGSCE